MLTQKTVGNFSLGITGADGFVGAYSAGSRTPSEGMRESTAHSASNVLAVNGSLVPIRLPDFSKSFRAITGTGRGLFMNRAFDSAGLFKAGASGTVAISGFSDSSLVGGYPSSYELEDGSYLKVNFGVGPHGDDVVGSGFKGISAVRGQRPSLTYNSGSSAVFADGTTGTARSLCYTIVRKVFDVTGSNLLYEFETNPSAIFTTSAGKGTDPVFTTLSNVSPYLPDLYPLDAVPNGTGLWVYRIYSSIPGLATGDYAKMFFATEYALPPSTVAPTLPTPSSIDYNRPLGHAYAGSASNPLYPVDHSGFPIIQRIGDALHGYSQASSFAGGCILASVDNILYQSLPGLPLYCQNAYARKADSFIEMIKPNQRISVVSSLSSLYTLTGNSPEDFSFDQVRNGPPVKYDSGLAAAWTPYGLVYPTEKSIVLFDGERVIDLGANRINRLTFGNFVRMSGVYIDDLYICWDESGKGYMLDLSNGPSDYPYLSELDLAATGQASTFKGACVTPLYRGVRDAAGSPSFTEGKRVAFVSYQKFGTAYARSFAPRQNSGDGDSTVNSPWSYQSNRVYLDAPGVLVDVQAWGLDWEGVSPTVTIKAFDYTGTQVWGKVYASGTDMKRRLTPKGVKVDYITFSIDAPDTCVAVHRLHFYYRPSTEFQQ